MIYSIHPEAENEFAAAAEYYDDQEEGLGASFSTEVFSTIDLVAKFPNSWPKFSHRMSMPLQSVPVFADLPTL